MVASHVRFVCEQGTAAASMASAWRQPNPACWRLAAMMRRCAFGLLSTLSAASKPRHMVCCTASRSRTHALLAEIDCLISFTPGTRMWRAQVRLWEDAEHSGAWQQSCSVSVEDPVMCVNFSPDSAILAAGAPCECHRHTHRLCNLPLVSAALARCQHPLGGDHTEMTAGTGTSGGAAHLYNVTREASANGRASLQADACLRSHPGLAAASA